MTSWNHNVAYHGWLERRLRGAASLLDVGCGDGTLLRRLGPGRRSVGIEPDATAYRRARATLSTTASATVLNCSFAGFDAPEESFDAVVFVASLHHLDLREALLKARDLLAPGGVLLIVGLAANRSALDWTRDALRVVPAWIGSRLHREVPDIGAPVATPGHSLRDVRAAATDILPGHRLRHGLYYRYLLSWRKEPAPITPGAQPGTAP